MAKHTPAHRAQRAKGRRNIIRGLVQSGIKINVRKASPFTQEQFERKRLKRISGLGSGRGQK